MTHWGKAAATALAFLALVYPWVHAGASGPSPGLEPLLASLFCVAALLALAAAAGARLNVPRTGAGLLAAAIVAVWFGDIVAHGQATPSPLAVAACLSLTAAAACVLVGGLANGAGTPGWQPALFAWAWLVAGLLSTLIALTQYFGFSDALGPLAAYSPGQQAYGNLRQKNQYASLASIGLLSLGWLVLHARPSPPRAAAAAMAVLLCAGIAAAASRTGVVQLLAVLAAAAWWHRGTRFKPRWIVAPLLCYLVVAIALPYVASEGGQTARSLIKRFTEDAPDCIGRTILWRNALDLVAQRPWLGWGWGEFSHAMYASSFQPRFCALVENAHNLPLHLAVELGVPTALGLSLLCLWAVAKAKPWAETQPARQLGWGVILLILIHSFFEYPLWYGPFQLALGLSLGLLWPQRGGFAVSRLALGTGAVAFGAAAVYIGLDYRRVSQLYLPAQSRAAAYQDATPEKLGASWLFRDHADFARLMATPMLPETAQALYPLAGRLLHFSPEPRVIEKRIQGARLLGLEAEADAEAGRYRAAFPARYADWAARQAPPPR